MSERDDFDQTSSPTTEGVRILGAEEAHRLANGGASGDSDSPEGGADRERADRATGADDADGPSVLYPDSGPSWSAADRGEVPPPVASSPAAPAEPPTGEIPPLPHWTEPPTGAVPAIFADDRDEVDDDLDAWATISGSQPRFRAEGSDWAEADYAEELSGEHNTFGALDEAEPVDEEAAFAEELAARRRRPARPRPTAPRAPAAPEHAPTGVAPQRDLATALMTAAAIAIIALISFRRPTWTALFACVIVGVATLELANALRTKALRMAGPIAFGASLTLPIAAKHYGPGAYPVYLVVVVLFSFLWFLLEVTPGRPLVGVATTVFAFGYVGGLGGFAGLLLAQHDGVGLVLGVAICTIAYDVVGYFVGSQFGRNRIAPRISPNKSVEGTVAGMVASVLFGLVVAGAISPWSHGHGFVLGVLVAIGAFLGDLCESMIKRDLGLKDFGSLLPGHGGVLDRFDGLLFCLPIAYYLALYFKIS